MSITEITAKVKELKELKLMAEELSAEITSLEDTIKAEMGEAEELIAGEYKIRWTHTTSTRFDTTAFKKAAPDMYAQFTKTTASRRFSIA